MLRLVSRSHSTCQDTVRVSKNTPDTIGPLSCSDVLFGGGGGCSDVTRTIQMDSISCFASHTVAQVTSRIFFGECISTAERFILRAGKFSEWWIVFSLTFTWYQFQ
jgi:hypothetical protein